MTIARKSGLRALKDLVKVPENDRAVWFLLDSLPVAVAFWERDGRLKAWNRPAERLFRRRGFVGQPYTALVPAESRPGISLNYERLRRKTRLEFESWRLRGDGSRFWASTIVRVLKDRGRRVGTVTIYHDLTRHREMEDALRVSERRFKMLAAACFEGIVVHRGGRIVLANRSMGRLLGRPAESLLGKSVYGLVEPASRGRLRRLRGQPLEISLLRADGSRGPAICRMRRAVYEGQPVQVLAVCDLSEAEKAVQARALAERQQEAQEAERRRVARELHDSVAQLLAAACSAVGTLRQDLDRAGRPSPALAARAQRAVAQALDEVRRIGRNMRPSVLDDFGLGPALRALGEEYSARTGAKVTLRLPRRAPLLSPQLELAVYRIAQESVGNAERHARASALTLSLRGERSGVSLEVADDGRGFAAPPAGDGQGLRNMRERSELLGGTVRVSSARGRGTTVRASFPARGARP